MTLNIDPLMDTFQEYSGKKRVFGAGHKKQLDSLKQITEQITEQGVFKAEITDNLEFPILKIQHNEKGFQQSYFIDFGCNLLGEKATLILSTGAAKMALKNRKNGFDLALEADRNEFLVALGKNLVFAGEAHDVRQAAIKYNQSKPVSQSSGVKKQSI